MVSFLEGYGNPKKYREGSPEHKNALKVQAVIKEAAEKKAQLKKELRALPVAEHIEYLTSRIMEDEFLITHAKVGSIEIIAQLVNHLKKYTGF